MKDVQLVFFDAGGTLVHPREDVGEVYAREGRRYGVDADAGAVLQAFLREFTARKADGRTQHRGWWRELVLATFAQFGQPTDPEALFDALWTHFMEPASWLLDPHALETVRALRRRGYRAGLISNWDARLPELLDGLGLTPLLDPIVISFRVGAEKPDSRIYEQALTEAGVTPEEALMVGDDYEADVEGARAAGLGAVWVRRRNHGGPRDGAEVPVIDELRELLDLL